MDDKTPAYEAPQIVEREALQGFLGGGGSDDPTFP